MASIKRIASENNASTLEEVDLKEIVHKPLDFFKENKENEIFKDLKDETYFKNLKKDIQENQGIENPVIAFEDGTLVEGHSRIKILRELVKEGKIPKSYKVPTLYFKGTKEEGNKRLILGNLNRFEIDPNTRTLLFVRVYPEYFDPKKNTKQIGGETVSTPIQKEVSQEMGLSSKQVKNEKAIVEEAIQQTKKPLEKLNTEDLKLAREKKNKERREKTQAKKNTPKPSQNQPSTISKPSPTQDRKEQIKALQVEMVSLETRLKEIKQELKKLGA